MAAVGAGRKRSADDYLNDLIDEYVHEYRPTSSAVLIMRPGYFPGTPADQRMHTCSAFGFSERT